jgi:hypothetical protein
VERQEARQGGQQAARRVEPVDHQRQLLPLRAINLLLLSRPLGVSHLQPAILLPGAINPLRVQDARLILHKLLLIIHRHHKILKVLPRITHFLQVRLARVILNVEEVLSVARDAVLPIEAVHSCVIQLPQRV